MKTLFIAAGPESWGSSRMRCYWPAKYMADAHVVSMDEARRMIDAPEVMIWQKWVDLDLIKANPQTRHYLDVCDPQWWWQPDLFIQAAAPMAGIVASSPALADDCAGFLGRGVRCIPDRLELAHFDRQAQYTERSPVRLIWFGVAVNRIALFAALANLERLAANGYAIELTICDDRPDDEMHWTDSFPIYHTRWTLESEVAVLTAHDIAILPPYPGPWGQVKSPNKTLTAWACGLPMTPGDYWPDLVDLVESANVRNATGIAGYRTVKQNHTVDKSAAEWEQLLCAS